MTGQPFSPKWVGWCVVIVGLGGVMNCGRAESPQEADSAPAVMPTDVTLSAEQISHGAVKWKPAAQSTVTETVELPGELKVDDDRTIRVSVPTRGRVLTVRANVGDSVVRDQVVASLLSDEATAARANAAKATAELGHHQAALDFARLSRERAERLLALKAVSQQEVERARTDEKAAAAAFAQAQADAERASTALAILDVDATTGHVQLRSTLAGVVLSRETVPGAVVDAGATMMVVTNPDSLWLQVAVPDRLASTIRSGARLRFSVAAMPGDTFDARVVRLATSVDPATRTVLVRAIVPNPKRRLRPEMLATVRLETGTPQTGVEVPDAAVQRLGDRPVVFIAEPDGRGGARFTPRDVDVAATAEGGGRIIRGVKPGELVVTEGAFTIKAQFGRSRIQVG
jgi:cobalt-zinc-cadmium efflux system membrane fusion protein